AGDGDVDARAAIDVGREVAAEAAVRDAGPADAGARDVAVDKGAGTGGDAGADARPDAVAERDAGTVAMDAAPADDAGAPRRTFGLAGGGGCSVGGAPPAGGGTGLVVASFGLALAAAVLR